MERTITVRGYAKTKMPADITSVSMKVSGKEAEFDEAMESMIECTAKIKDAIAKAGLPRNELKTSNVSIEQSFRKRKIGTDKNGYDKFETVPDGFSYEQDVIFEFPNDNRKLTDVIRNIKETGVTPMIVFGYRNSNPESVKNELLAQSSRNAFEEARAIVEAVGSKLGRLLAVDRRGGYDDDDYVPRRRTIEYDDVCCNCAAPPLDIDPDDITVGQEVVMTWEIAD